KIFLMIPLVSSIIWILSHTTKGFFKNNRNEGWVGCLFLLILISLFNPNNYAPLGTIGFLVLFISYIGFFKLMYISLNLLEILKAIFTSLLLLCALQFVLAVLYPFL